MTNDGLFKAPPSKTFLGAQVSPRTICFCRSMFNFLSTGSCSVSVFSLHSQWIGIRYALTKSLSSAKVLRVGRFFLLFNYVHATTIWSCRSRRTCCAVKNRHCNIIGSTREHSLSHWGAPEREQWMRYAGRNWKTKSIPSRTSRYVPLQCDLLNIMLYNMLDNANQQWHQTSSAQRHFKRSEEITAEHEDEKPQNPQPIQRTNNCKASLYNYVRTNKQTK